MEIRSLYNFPIVFFAGYQDEEILAKTKSIESSICLIKPAEPEDIELAIKIA